LTSSLAQTRLQNKLLKTVGHPYLAFPFNQAVFTLAFFRAEDAVTVTVADSCCACLSTDDLYICLGSGISNGR